MISAGLRAMVADRATTPRRSMAAALLGFFIITLDALVVSVALQVDQ